MPSRISTTGEHPRPPHTTKRDESLFRKIPSVDLLLSASSFQELTKQYPREAVVTALRSDLQALRHRVRNRRLPESEFEHTLEAVPARVRAALKSRFSPSLRRVINATGVVLHTNLGRAPLSPAVFDRTREAGSGYSNLEFDLAKNERGKRDVHAEHFLKNLLRCEAALVVNNCAAAVLLALNSLAEGGEVIVSRGELVEIGGSFRVPDIMRKSGAVLREVGTTNRTRLSDYQRAINARTKLILQVHRSNFKIVGFSEQPALEELARLAHKKRLPILEDLGSGCLVDLREAGICGEPTVQQSLKAGVDVITFSGDKLLGGPQAGLIAGRRKYLHLLRTNPLYRALRVDKLTLGALEATLHSYLRQDERNSIPALKMIFESPEHIEARAQQLMEQVRQQSGENSQLEFEIKKGVSVIGGGSTPGQEIATVLIVLNSPAHSARSIESVLRNQSVPILARIEGNKVLLDLRTVFEGDEENIVRALIDLSRPLETKTSSQ